MTAPIAALRPHVHSDHGVHRPDPYHWLKQRDDPEVIAYLEAENAWTETGMGHTKPMQKALYDEMLARIQEDDTTAPWPRGPWQYYTRTVAKMAYAIHCRRLGDDGDEVVLLDENARAEGHEYYSADAVHISPNHRYVAWLEDTSGAEQFVLQVLDTHTNNVLPHAVEGCKWSLAWGDDDTIYFTRGDAAQRPCSIVRHRIHGPADDDVVVLHEPDELYYLAVGRTRDGAFVEVDLHSKVSTEVQLIDTSVRDAKPRVVWPRRPNIEYSVAHADGTLYILTNEDAQNFKLVSVPASDPSAEPTSLVPHDPDVLLARVDTFNDHLVLSVRHGGLPHLRILDRHTLQAHEPSFPEEAYEVSLSTNAEADTTTLRFTYSSPIRPQSTYAYDMVSRERTLLRVAPVRGGHDPQAYVCKRLWAHTGDGARVPITVFHRRGAQLDGSNPCFLQGYGSYGYRYPASFSSARRSLLDRGVVYAIAHVRGGSELGRAWYDDGKFFQKAHSFTDFIAVAEHLIQQRYTTSSRLCICGGSAGGLLMGAVLNLRPDLFAAAIAQVPFVDVVNTMLDASLPLTVLEYKEWGDPNDRAVFDYLLTYSPYDNVSAQDYPALFVTAGLNDPRVGYWEPAKWVAKLRSTGTGDRPIFLRTHLGAGHGGASGRYGRLVDIAWEYAFLLDQLGVAP